MALNAGRATNGEADPLNLTDLDLTALGSTPAVTFGTSYAAGTASTFLRTDDQIKFPVSLLSAANASTLTLTDDASDQTLTGSLGGLTLSVSGAINLTSGGNINANIGSSGVFTVVAPSGLTSASTGLVQIKPGSGNLIGLRTSHFGGATLNTVTLAGWDSQMNSLAHNSTSVTYIGYDTSTLTVSPVAGSSTGNLLYGARLRAQIGTTNGSWTEAAALYAIGARRSILNPTIPLGCGIIVDAPTIGSTDQIGVYIRQQTAQQIATNRIGLKIDAQNSGTNRWAFWGSNKFHCDASDFIANASAFGFCNRDSQSSSAGGGGTARYWRMFTDASATGVAGDVTIAIDSVGNVTATRAGGATGTVLLKLIDVGTAAVTT